MSHVELSLKGVLEVLVCEYAQIGVGGVGGGLIHSVNLLLTERMNQLLLTKRTNRLEHCTQHHFLKMNSTIEDTYIMSANAFSSTMGLGNLVTSRS